MTENDGLCRSGVRYTHISGTSDNGHSEEWTTFLQRRNCLPSPMYYKWKNHFYEMKGDVGMPVHEKERKQVHQDTNSFITPSLHLCSEFCLFVVNALGKEKTFSH